MSNLIERLRDAQKYCGTWGADICNEAADALEQAQGKITMLEAIEKGATKGLVTAATRIEQLEARIKEMHDDAPYDEETDSFIVDGMLLRALLYAGDTLPEPEVVGTFTCNATVEKLDLPQELDDESQTVGDHSNG